MAEKMQVEDAAKNNRDNNNNNNNNDNNNNNNNEGENQKKQSSYQPVDLEALGAKMIFQGAEAVRNTCL